MKRLLLLVTLILGCILLAIPAHATLIDPTPYGGNPRLSDLCPDCEVFFKIEPVIDVEDYEVPGDLGTLNPTVTLDVNEEAKTFDWTSSQFLVDCVLVKGGNGANLYNYLSQGWVFGDTGLHAPINASGGFAGLSNVSFGGSIPPRPRTCHNAPCVHWVSRTRRLKKEI